MVEDACEIQVEIVNDWWRIRVEQSSRDSQKKQSGTDVFELRDTEGRDSATYKEQDRVVTDLHLGWN